jgi:hypothetical protein
VKYIFFCITLGLAAPAAAQDHRDVVAQVAAETPPDHTLEGALSFTLRVVNRLNALYPQEHAGLLEKVAGESIQPYSGTLVSASRICYPNQKLFKILTDVPTTNGPEWSDDGYAAVGGYIKGYFPIAAAPVVAPPVIVPPPAPIFDTAALETAIANLRADVDAHRQEFQAFTAEVHGWKSEAGAFLAKYVLPELATVIATWKLAK